MSLVFNRIEKIVSGGQTGADRAGLEAAHALGIATGGWAPPGFMTSSGSDLALRDVFHLDEITMKGPLARMYIERSKRNVDMADGTLAFRLYSSAGTDKTIQYCSSGRWEQWKHMPSTYKPILVITQLDDTRNAEHIQRFISENNIKILNIAGHRGSRDSAFFISVNTLLQEALKMFTYSSSCIH